MLQVGINNLQLPNGIQRAEVYHDMPLGSLPALPVVTVSMDLLQQDAIGIGQNIPNVIPSQNYRWTMPALARRIWRITVVAKDVETREFYRDACIQIYETLIPTIFLNLGQNVTHKFQAASSQWIEELRGVYPGFYIAEIMVELIGLFNTNIKPAYPAVSGVLVGLTAGTPSIAASGMAG